MNFVNKTADVILHVKDRGPIRYPRMATVEHEAAILTHDRRTDAYVITFDPLVRDHLETYLDVCQGDVQVRIEKVYLPGGRAMLEVHIEPVVIEGADGERKAPEGPTAAVAAPTSAWFAKGGHA